MAKSVRAFRDEKGHLHLTAEEAIVADIALILGRVGDEGGLTKGVARIVLENRKKIRKAFAEYESLLGAECIGDNVIDVTAIGLDGGNR